MENKCYKRIERKGWVTNLNRSHEELISYSNNNGCIISCEGSAEEIVIPSNIGGDTIKSIGKKAFLGNRYLQSITLPDSIETVGDWAFSGCRMLQKVTLPYKEITFGAHIFHRSEQIREISFPGCSESCAKLLAAAVVVLRAEYLLSPLQAGYDTWYQSLDAAILSFLKEPEESALRDLVYCAEEDMSAKQEACIMEHLRRKADIAFLRLLYPEKISPDMHVYLTEYLLQRTKGCQDESAWEAVKTCQQNKLRYCDKLYEIGGISEENIHAALDDLGEDNVELKAYLMKKRQTGRQDVNLWEALKLE